MNYYPVFLNLKNKKAVVIGGGQVAERKILSLLKSDAVVTVVSPRLTNRLLTEREKGKFHHIERSYKKQDIRDAFLVIAATDSPDVNTVIARNAPALVNVVDVPAECNFIAPSVLKRGALLIAISTSGTSPALSRAVRKELEKLYGTEFSDYLKFAGKVREKAFSRIEEKRKRELFLKELASEKTVTLLRNKGLEAVKASVLERLEKLVSSSG